MTSQHHFHTPASSRAQIQARSQARSRRQALALGPPATGYGAVSQHGPEAAPSRACRHPQHMPVARPPALLGLRPREGWARDSAGAPRAHA